MSSIYIREKEVKQPSMLVFRHLIFLADAKLDTKKKKYRWIVAFYNFKYFSPLELQNPVKIFTEQLFESYRKNWKIFCLKNKET